MDASVTVSSFALCEATVVYMLCEKTLASVLSTNTTPNSLPISPE